MVSSRLVMLLAAGLVALAGVPLASAHSIDPLFPKCVVVSDQPDMGEKVCVDPADPDCTVYEVRVTFLGTEKNCIYPSGGCGSGCSTAMADPSCYEVYGRTDIGTYSIVRRDSCHVEAYSCPTPGAPISQCQPLISSLFTPAAAMPLPSSCYRSGMGELQSRTCIDPTSTDCAVYQQRTTGVGSDWWCYPSGEHGSSGY